MSLLIKNAKLLGAAELQDIHIDQGRIVAVGSALTVERAAVADAAGNLVIPGLINAHCHFDKSLIIDRKRYKDEPPPVRAGWVRDLKARFTREDIKARAAKALEWSYKKGIVGIRTNVDVDPLVGLTGIEALLELKAEWRDRVDIQVVAFCQEGFQRYPETKELLAEAMRLGADAIGGHTTIDGLSSAEHIDTIFDLAQQFDADIDFHADETGRPDDHMLPYVIQKIKDTGYQGRVNAVHCCSLAVIPSAEAAADIEGLKETATRVVVCPTAIATRQLTTVKELLAAGVPIGLGTDNIQDLFNPLGNGDMFDVARLLAYVKRMYEDHEQEALFAMLTATGRKFVDVSRFDIRPGNVANLCVLGFSEPAEMFRSESLLVKRII